MRVETKLNEIKNQMDNISKITCELCLKEVNLLYSWELDNKNLCKVCGPIYLEKRNESRNKDTSK